MSNEKMTRLTASDGHAFDAFVAEPEGAARGGLVVVQEIFGMTDQLKSVARAWAADGYRCVLPAMFDRVAPATVVPFDTPDRGRELMVSLDPEQVLLDLGAALGAADTGHGASLLGFCWGGGQVLHAATRLDFTAGVSFYGTKLGEYLATPARCPLQFHCGETDSHSPPEVIDAVRTALPDAEVYVYAAGHAFANDARPSYVPEAAMTARERALAFLNRHHPA